MGRGIFYPGGLNKAPYFMALVNAWIDHDVDWKQEVAAAKDDFPDLWDSMMATVRENDPDATDEELEGLITDDFMKETHYAHSIEELSQRHYDDLESEILTDLIDEIAEAHKLKPMIDMDDWRSGNYHNLTRAKNDDEIILFAGNDDVVIGAVLDDGMIPVLVMPRHLADPKTQDLDEFEDDEHRGMFGVDRNQRLNQIAESVAVVGKAVALELLNLYPGNVHSRETAWTMGPLVIPITAGDRLLEALGKTPTGAIEFAMGSIDSDWLEAA